MDKLTTDALLEDLGGCGLFQCIVTTSVYGSVTAACWSMVLMAFGSYNPGWACADPDALDMAANESTSESRSSNVLVADSSDSTQKREWQTTTCTNYSSCGNVIFSDDSSTIATEWGLICDRFYITSSIISIQMAGVLLGTLLGGNCSNWIGRKATHYSTLAAHAILNTIIIFSVNWQMFAALRFSIGITCGVLFITSYLFSIEFIPRRWRSIVSTLPFWNIGGLLFSAIAMLLRDWRYLHIATVVLTALLFLPVFFVPESLRWLAVKGKINKAYSVGEQIGRWNRKQTPVMEVIDLITKEEKKRQEENPRVSVLYLYRRQFLKRTIITSVMWLCYTLVYYAIYYGVKSLSGDFYVNLMITTCITTISYPLAPLLANTVGRKLACVLLLAVAGLGCICLVCLHFLPVSIDQGLATLILTLLVLMFTDTSWCVGQLYTVELFPTILRSLGLSHASCFARIGGMIAPFLIPTESDQLYISHIIMAIFIVLTGVLILFLSETKTKQMQDSMKLDSGEASNCNSKNLSKLDEHETLT